MRGDGESWGGVLQHSGGTKIYKAGELDYESQFLGQMAPSGMEGAERVGPQYPPQHQQHHHVRQLSPHLASAVAVHPQCSHSHSHHPHKVDKKDHQKDLRDTEIEESDLSNRPGKTRLTLCVLHLIFDVVNSLIFEEGEFVASSEILYKTS